MKRYAPADGIWTLVLPSIEWIGSCAGRVLPSTEPYRIRKRERHAETDGQTGKRTDRQTDRHTDGQIALVYVPYGRAGA